MNRKSNSFLQKMWAYGMILWLSVVLESKMKLGSLSHMKLFPSSIPSKKFVWTERNNNTFLRY